MTPSQYLDAIKKRHKIESDYELAQVLGVTRQTISYHRSNKTTLDNLMCARVAQQLDIDPLHVIADQEQQRAKTPDIAAFWRKLAAGVVMAIGSATLGGLAPAPAQAGPLHNQILGPDNTHMVRRRKWFDVTL